MKKLKSTKKTNFLFKLNQLLNQSNPFPENTTNDEKLTQIISWNEDGTVILIKDRKQFEELILPKYFLYKKYNNFIRQLHMYDFKKLRNYKNDQIAYKNEKFTKNGYSNLEINRKKVIHHYKTKKKIMKFNKNITNCNDNISNVDECDINRNDNQLSEYESRIQNIENSINLMKKNFINSKKDLPVSSHQSQTYLNTTSQTQTCVNNTDNDYNLNFYYKRRLEKIIKTIKKYLIYKNNKITDEDDYLYNQNLEQYDDRTTYLLINKLNSHYLKSSRNDDEIQSYCPFQSVVRDYNDNNKILMIKSYSQDFKSEGMEKISNYNYLTDDNCSSNS